MARRGTEEEWRKRLKRWSKFEDTIATFCASEGVSTKSFYTWRKRLRGGPPASERVEFVEIERTTCRGPIELALGDVLVRVGDGFDETTLRRVLDVLAGRQ